MDWGSLAGLALALTAIARASGARAAGWGR